MWDVKACRGCLSTKNKLERISDMYRKFYTNLTGLEISDTDGFPMYFCAECHMHIKKALAFKRKCRRAHFILKEIVIVKKQVLLNDIKTVNRRKVNLASPLSLSKVHNVKLFTIDTVGPDPDTVISWGKGEIKKQKVSIKNNVWHLNIWPDGFSEPNFDTDVPDEQTIKTKAIQPKLEQSIQSNIGEEEFNETHPEIKEPFSDAESIESLPLTVEKKSSKSIIFEGILKELKRTGKMISDASYALTNANIKRLSYEEQMEIFDKAKNYPLFLNSLFRCNMCITTYDTLGSLTLHLAEHDLYANESYKCDVCLSQFANETNLTIHKGEKHLYEYTCKLCDNQVFYDLDAYVQHSQTAHSDIKRKAEILKTIKPDLNNNIKQFYDVYSVDNETMFLKLCHRESLHECTHCNMKFTTEKVVSTHVKKHFTPSKNFECDICGIYTRNSVRMALHMQLWHLFAYKCLICGNWFYNKQEAKYHYKTLHQKSSYDCEFCDKKFKRVNAWRWHCSSSHYNVFYRHPCSICGNCFFCPEHMYRHQLTVHKYINVINPDVTEGVFLCEVCNVKFANVKAYMFHCMKFKHEIAKTFENSCIVCMKIFNTETEYQEHLNTSCRVLLRYPQKCLYCEVMMDSYKMYRRHHKCEHKGLPLRRLRAAKLCEICGIDSMDLKSHMKMHDDDYVSSFECLYCSPPLKIDDVQKYCIHTLYAHTPKPFVCGYCHSAYAKRQQCRDHILKEHQPEKPYKCVTCSEEFSIEEYLDRHCKRTKHEPLKSTLPKVSTIKRIYLYPHMKLNVSMLDSKIRNMMKLYLVDYEKTKRELINNKNEYFVFEKQDGVSKRVKKRLSNKLGVNVVKDLFGKSKMCEKGGNNFDKVFNEEILAPVKKKAKNKNEVVVQSVIDVYERNLFGEDYINLGNDGKKPEVVDSELDDADNAVLDLNGEKLNVVEQDGKFFVSISGVLYEVLYEDI